jgi:ribulose-5-phosphate 4-epimerase/fuculose-1-phosphate aldolase
MKQTVNEVKQALVFAHRLFAAMGWDDLTYTHLSARHPERASYFIMPFGFLFEEVTMDHLLEVDFDGQILNHPEHAYNPTGHVIHGAVYQARSDVHVVFHAHTPDNIAVASMKDGLLPLSQWALLFYERWHFHAYDALSLKLEKEGARLVEDLGQATLLLMRNHGSLIVGQSIAEVFYYQYHFEMACRTQCQLLALNQSYVMPDEACCRKSAEQLHAFEQHNGMRDWMALKRKYRSLWPEIEMENVS